MWMWCCGICAGHDEAKLAPLCNIGSGENVCIQCCQTLSPMVQSSSRILWIFGRLAARMGFVSTANMAVVTRETMSAF